MYGCSKKDLICVFSRYITKIVLILSFGLLQFFITKSSSNDDQEQPEEAVVDQVVVVECSVAVVEVVADYWLTVLLVAHVALLATVR